MKKKLIILLSSFTLIHLLGLFSCQDDLGCGPFPDRFKTIGLNWNVHKATYSEMADDKLILESIGNDTVDFNVYGIFIQPEIKTYFAQNFNRWDFGLIQTAYACTPFPPITEETIDSIVILSDTDFDLDHPAGTDLSSLFDVIVLDYPKNLYDNKFSLEEYLSTNPTVPTEMTLILKQQPDSASAFEFVVKYYQQGVDDNDYFELRTSNIVIR